MSIYHVQGVCVGLKDEIIEYMKDGKLADFRRIGVSFNTFNCDSEPETIEVSEEQKSMFRPLQCYRFPVEFRAGVMKNGNAYSRVSIPKNARIETLTQSSPAVNSAPPAK